MFKLVKLAIFLAFVAAIVYGVHLYRSRVEIVEKLLTKQLGQEVHIGRLQVGLNELTADMVRIKNPEGSIQPYALTIQTLTIKLSFFELFKDIKKIHSIQIAKPTFFLELYDSSGMANNWATIIQSLPPKKGPSALFEIEELTIRSLTFAIMRANGKALPSSTLPYLSFHNLGTIHPLTIGEIGQLLFESLAQGLIQKPHLSEILDGIEKAAPDLLKGATSTLPKQLPKGYVKKKMDKWRRKTKEKKEQLKELFAK